MSKRLGFNDISGHYQEQRTISFLIFKYFSTWNNNIWPLLRRHVRWSASKLFTGQNDRIAKYNLFEISTILSDNSSLNAFPDSKFHPFSFSLRVYIDYNLYKIMYTRKNKKTKQWWYSKYIVINFVSEFFFLVEFARRLDLSNWVP